MAFYPLGEETRVQDRETTQPPVGRRLGECGPRLLECSDAERKYRQDTDILSLEKRGAGGGGGR